MAKVMKNFQLFVNNSLINEAISSCFITGRLYFKKDTIEQEQKLAHMATNASWKHGSQAIRERRNDVG